MALLIALKFSLHVSLLIRDFNTRFFLKVVSVGQRNVWVVGDSWTGGACCSAQIQERRYGALGMSQWACPSVDRNTQYRENDEVTQNVESWGACRDLCRQRDDCRHWTWHQENSGQHALKCITMTGYGYTNGHNNVMSGDRDCGTGMSF